jgi:Zn-dependent membrane protease YugP
VNALTSVVTATNTLCEDIFQTAKQTVEFVEHNFNGASSRALKPASQAVGHASRTAKI